MNNINANDIEKAAEEFISKQDYRDLQENDKIYAAFIAGANFVFDNKNRKGIPTYLNPPPPPPKKIEMCRIDNTYSILKEALEIVEGSRNANYGNAVDTYNKIAEIASIICDKEITASDCCDVMIVTKLVRESYKHKRDNLVDLAGYAEIANKLRAIRNE